MKKIRIDYFLPNDRPFYGERPRTSIVADADNITDAMRKFEDEHPDWWIIEACEMVFLEE